LRSCHGRIAPPANWHAGADRRREEKQAVRRMAAGPCRPGAMPAAVGQTEQTCGQCAGQTHGAFEAPSMRTPGKGKKEVLNSVSCRKGPRGLKIRRKASKSWFLDRERYPDPYLCNRAVRQLIIRPRAVFDESSFRVGREKLSLLTVSETSRKGTRIREGRFFPIPARALILAGR